MSKLFFNYGAMGSSKTASALMCQFNYEERGQKALLVKSEIDKRDGEFTIRSRIGLEKECITLSMLMDYTDEQLKKYQAIIVDEVQFATIEQIDKLSDIVDFLDIPVLCYGLRADFQNNLFPGSERLMTIADEINELKTICWCGRKAICNARYNEDGIVREGKKIVLGTNDSYCSLCRKHFKLGQLAPINWEGEDE